MFLGRFAHNLDSKGRLAVPARFRASLEKGLVLTRGLDRCVGAYPMTAWKELAGKVSGDMVFTVDEQAGELSVAAELAPVAD